MILRLILFCMTYATAGVVGTMVAIYIGKRALRAPLERHRRRVQGMRNAKLLEEHEDVCFSCLKKVDPRADAYNPGYGWYHLQCMQQLLIEGEK